MSGVDGAIKLNSFNAPSVKNTGTEKKKRSVSAFAVEKTVEEFVKDLMEIPVEEFIEEEAELQEDQKEETPEVVIEETVEPVIEQPVELEPIIEIPVDLTVQENKKSKKPTIKTEFNKVKDYILSMYQTAFVSKDFKPTFEQTVGDLLLYLSKKLSLKGAESAFNQELSLIGVTIPDKYASGYIPLSIKLAKWCESNGFNFTAEELLYLISSLYLTASKQCGVLITELDIANDFDAEINYSL
ncbi:MAG: hypothetical protein IKJ14_02500 [Clostridia bacterium]|nr:hypothetical protein [Clostridia bacterium]